METLTWQTLDWAALDQLRDQFLGRTPSSNTYWSSRSDLANYDFTFAQRIGWKWDAVLRELRVRQWTPPPGALLDWGCGSGIASRRVLEFFGAERLGALRVFDRSPLAMQFAAERAQAAFPSLRIEQGEPDSGKIGTLVVSHVLSELDEAGGRDLRQAIDRAHAVLWVEPGTHADSRALIALREDLRSQFVLIAPCPHQAACGLLAPENERHWCHHFAASLPGIMADANWVRFAQRAGIDLRRLPYSFLVLERQGARASVPGMLGGGWTRVVGEPRVYKGFAKILSCQAEGVSDVELQKRDAREVFKAIQSERGPMLLRAERDARRFTRVEEVVLTPPPTH